MNHDYKERKEEFVSGLSGSTITHVNLLSLSALLTITLYAALYTRTTSWKRPRFLPQWALLVIPLLLSMTVFAEKPVILNLLLLVPIILLLRLPAREGDPPLPSASPMAKSFPRAPAAQAANTISPLPALTTLRAHMLLMTCLAILAVDFPIFPRSLAKCETFGVSLMDMGVGAFVFSQGIVSAIPILKNPAHLRAPVLPKLFRTLRKSLPVIAIGVVRVLLVKGAQYPEHESEYGRHWNFFITLALVPVLEVFLHPLMEQMSISLLGVCVGVVQQILLSQFGMMDYVLNAPRDTIVSANKEGIVSLPGYLAIHLLGVSLGTLVIPPSPSYFARSQKMLNKKKKTVDAEDDREVSLNSPRQNSKTATEISAYVIIWWTATIVVNFLQKGMSRRVVNLSYILWIAAYNTSFLLGNLVIDLYFFPTPEPSRMTRKAEQLHAQHGTTAFPSGTPPSFLEAVNKNALVLFLLANVCTGLVNLTFPTMYMSDFSALVILGLYSYAICVVAWIFKDRRLLNL